LREFKTHEKQANKIKIFINDLNRKGITKNIKEQQ
jgi:hypothetical protein